MGRPFKIDGVTIPTPTTYVCDIDDLSSSETGRTLDGVMHKDVVAVKDTYACTWKRLSWSDAATLLNALDGKASFSLTYADPRCPGQYLTNTFYVGKRSGTAMDLSDPDDDRAWCDISMTFIRV